MSRKFVIVLAVLLGALALPAFATTEVFEVRATLRQPIAITEVANLDFGIIEIPASPTLFTIVNTSNSSVTQLNGGHSAEFDVTGEASTAVTVSVTSSVTATVNLTTLTFNLTVNPSGASTFDGSGNLNVIVGGNVTVGPTADSGVYSNTTDATLTVVYQ